MDKALNGIKKSSQSQEHPGPVPHAPNRNMINPPTRAPTPLPRTESMTSIDVCPRHYKRPTLEEEEKTFGRVFKGTTTLTAYDLGAKLGEGTFGYIELVISMSQADV